MIKAYSGIYAYSGIRAYLGITGLDGIGATDALLSASTFYIDPVKAHTVDGWLNFDKIDALSYHGTNPNGIGVSQATEANQAIMLVTPQYEEDGFASSDEDDFALTGKGWLTEPEGVEYSRHTEFPSNLTTSKGTVSNYGSDDTFTITSPDNGSSSNGLTLSQNIPAAVDTTTIIDFYSDTTDLTVVGAFFEAQAWNPTTASVSFEVVSGPGSLLLVSGTSLFQLSNLDSVTPTRLRIKVEGSDVIYYILNYTDGTGVTTGKSIRVGKYVQCRAGLHDALSSVIFATTTPITRAADNGYDNTNTAFVDRNPDFTGSAGNISLVGSKYEGLGTADWEGAVYYNTDGTESHCTAFVGASSLTWDGDINAGGLLTFTRSDFKDDPAAMLALRTAAGDTGPEQTKSVTMTVGNAAGSVYGYSTGNIVVAGAFGSMSDVNFVTGQALIVFGISSSGGNTVVTLAGDVDLTYVGDVVVNIAGYDVTLQHVTVGFVVGYRGTLTGTALFDAVAAEDGNDIDIEYTYNAFAKIPTSEFRRRFEFIPQANSGDYSDDRKLTGSYTDADNYTELTVLANGNIRFDSDNATTNSTVTNTTTPLVAGQVTVIDLEIGAVSASNGSSMSVNADKDTFTLNAELYYNSTIAYCGGGDGVNKGFPIRILRDTWYDSMGNIILDKTFDGLVS